MLHVSVPCPTEDENVIEVDDQKSTQMFSEDVIDEPHESGWGISEIERHDFPLKKNKFGLELFFPNILWVHSNLMVVSCQIQFSKPLSSLEGVE
jgi:hypothetical protein